MCFHFFSSYFQFQLYFKGNKMNYDLGVAPSYGAAAMRDSQTKMIIHQQHRDNLQPREIREEGRRNWKGCFNLECV
jgi:hypothetical protein